ncbi:hypothetical protein ACMFMG_011702 [Clarireedia jacksonii]
MPIHGNASAVIDKKRKRSVETVSSIYISEINGTQRGRINAAAMGEEAVRPHQRTISKCLYARLNTKTPDKPHQPPRRRNALRWPLTVKWQGLLAEGVKRSYFALPTILLAQYFLTDIYVPENP